MRQNEHGNTDIDYRRARELRNNASPCEKKLWAALRDAAAAKGLKFRRQQAVHPYLADFACMKARLLVELDGTSHDVRQKYDQIREEYLKQKGFVIVRFTNEDVAKNVEGVVMVIIKQAEMVLQKSNGDSRSSSPLPNPPHEGEGFSS